MTDRKQRILLVEGEDDVRSRVVDALGDEYDIDVASTVPGAIERLAEDNPSLVMTDLEQPDVDGLDVVAVAHGLDADLPIVILTDADNLDSAMEAMRLGAFDYVMKPLPDASSLRRSVQRALGAAALRRENARLLEDLRRSTRFQGHLMRTVSHDFKNMLTVIMGYGRLAQMHPHAPLVPECLDHIMATARMMSLMAEDLSIYGQLGTQALVLEPRDLPLTDCVADALKSVLFDAATHRFEICGCDERVYADRQRTTQILTNLLGNAVKYSPRGGAVRISARRVADEVEVSVADEGMGIPAEDIEHLFRPFFRLPRDAQSGIPGTGLGLTIVQSLVEAQKGRIWATSQEGAGATFTFTLPAANPDDRPTPQPHIG